MNAAAVEVAAAPEAHEARKLHARLNTASRMSRRDGDRTITFCFRQNNPECTYSAYRIGDYTSGRIVNTQCQKPLSSSWWSSVLWKRAVLSPVYTSDNVAKTGDIVAETGDIVAKNTMLPVSATMSPFFGDIVAGVDGA